MVTENPQKTPSFECVKCNMITRNKKDYSKHLLTPKHQKTNIGDTKGEIRDSPLV